MQHHHKSKYSSWISGLLILWMGSLGVVSCAASPNQSINRAQGDQETAAVPTANAGLDLASQPAEQSKPNDLGSQSNLNTAENSESRQAPQLIKTARLTLRVNDVDKSLEQVSTLLNQQKGDLLKLEEQSGNRNRDRTTYFLKLRVPQNNLNATLKALEAFGTVKNRSIQAEDVSDQLIDAQARLKNLRKSEEMVLKIMERSGKIPDVLGASRELSTIRENIERIDAQLQNLKTKVAFSTITLTVESSTAAIQPVTGVGVQLQDAWKQSTHAMGNVTMALVKLGIWGVAFSPYLIGLGAFIWFARLYRGKVTSKSNFPESKV